MCEDLSSDSQHPCKAQPWRLASLSHSAESGGIFAELVHLVEVASSTLSETQAQRSNVKVVKEQASVYIWPTHMPIRVSRHKNTSIQGYNAHAHALTRMCAYKQIYMWILMLPCKPTCHVILKSQCSADSRDQSSSHPFSTLEKSMSTSHSSHLRQYLKAS